MKAIERLTQKVARMLIEPPRVAFEDRFSDRKMVGYELKIIIIWPRDRREGLSIETVPIRDKGDQIALPHPGFLPLKEVSKIYNLSLNILRRLCREKKIHCQKIDGKWHIDKNSLEAYRTRSYNK